MAVEHEDADIFNHIKVATYNVGASQDISFQSHGKMEDFKTKLMVSSTGETGGWACIHHPKSLREAGPIRREGPSCASRS